MATRADATRAYSLKSTLNRPVHVSCLCHIPILEIVIEANGVRDVPKDPALYVTLALSGNKLGKTEINRNRTPSWDETFLL
jgi:hypothetical protein